MFESFQQREDRRKVAEGDAIYAYPITGLVCSEEEAQISYIQLLKFNQYEWWTVEKSAFIEDWTMEYEHTRPMWAYFSVPSLVANEESCQMLVNTFVESLRIFKKGYMLEPLYTVQCKYEDGTSVREPGIYRSKYIEAIWGDENRQKGLSLSASEFGAVEQLFSKLLWAKQAHPQALQGILDCFNLIHVPAVRPAFIVHSLMICFEMLFGGREEFVRFKSQPQQRAVKLMERLGGLDAEIRKYIMVDIRKYRNKVHHGYNVPVEELWHNLNMLEKLLRMSIQAYLDLLVDLNSDTSKKTEYRAFSPQLEPRVVFNRMLMA